MNQLDHEEQRLCDTVKKIWLLYTFHEHSVTLKLFTFWATFTVAQWPAKGAYRTGCARHQFYHLSVDALKTTVPEHPCSV